MRTVSNDMSNAKKADISTTFTNSVLIFIAGSSYGFIVPVIKTANENGIFPSTVLPLQYLIALVASLIFVLVRRIEWSSPKKLCEMAILGIFTGGTSICYYTAVTLLPSSAALTLLFQYVWISVLIECIHKRKLPTLSSVVSIAVILIGTVFATGLLDGDAISLNPIGVVFGAASAVFYALFLYFSGIIGVGQPTALRAVMLAAGGVIATSIVSPGAYIAAVQTPQVWPYSFALSILGIIFPTTVINYASPKLSAGMVSIMASSELPVGILAAWVLVADVPSPLVIFGSILVLLGIFLKQIPALLVKGKDRTAL